MRTERHHHRQIPRHLTATTYTTIGNRLTALARPLPNRLLGVWAHPDDEAYLSAGLMARVVDAGGRVTVVTATRGEKGTDDPVRYDHDEFGSHRERELRASLAGLGVDDVGFLGLRDGECDSAAASTAIDAVTAAIREFAPDAIVTFGPDGMTNHPDHRAVSAWTTEAWRRVGDERPELLYATVTHDHQARYRDVHERLGIFADCDRGTPVTVGRAAVALEIALDDAELDRKRRALAAHASQTAGLAASMGEPTYREWFRNERFRRPTAAELRRCDLAAATPARVLVGAGR